MNVADVRQDVYLTGFALDYDFNDQGQFVHPVICPYFDCKSSSYKYKYFDKEVTDYHVSDIKGDKTPPNIRDYGVTEGSGSIITRAYMKLVSDEEIKQAPDPIKPLEDAVVFLTRGLLLQQELRMETIRAATTRTAAATQVFDHASATVRANILSAKIALRDACGREATHLVLGTDTWDELVSGASWVADIKYQDFFNVWGTTGTTFASKDRILGLVPVAAGALYNTAAAGATRTLGHTTGNDGYLVRVAKGGRDYTWMIQPRLSGFTVVKERDDMIGGWWVKVQHQISLKEVGADGLYELTAVTD